MDFVRLTHDVAEVDVGDILAVLADHAVQELAALLHLGDGALAKLARVVV